MGSKKTIVLVSLAIGLAFLWCALSSQAQSEEKYRARLSMVPPLGMAASAVVGTGSASATLAVRKLVVTGSFERLASPATVAHLCLGPITGVRGDAVFDLGVSKTGNGTSGGLAGTFDLTAQQVEALKKGRFYIQLHSEGAPNGHLMGWLLK